jgi:hypothetical protein
MSNFAWFVSLGNAPAALRSYLIVQNVLTIPGYCASAYTYCTGELYLY